ncbi:hypothetical protein NDU88_002637 [Pleurodeles waltl]|uniref:Uncharacterized protein n=1 Tax=Pleurodeles waltl TaxID=8319 RepID=A0AAV7QDH8_PLEWA|nr:hypothetical protein NDU88_002637 [Pleurodeles waltl]
MLRYSEQRHCRGLRFCLSFFTAQSDTVKWKMSAKKRGRSGRVAMESSLLLSHFTLVVLLPASQWLLAATCEI